jgi:hypothetical protein
MDKVFRIISQKEMHTQYRHVEDEQDDNSWADSGKVTLTVFFSTGHDTYRSINSFCWIVTTNTKGYVPGEVFSNLRTTNHQRKGKERKDSFSSFLWSARKETMQFLLSFLVNSNAIQKKLNCIDKQTARCQVFHKKRWKKSESETDKAFTRRSEGKEEASTTNNKKRSSVRNENEREYRTVMKNWATFSRFSSIQQSKKKKQKTRK